MFRVGADVERRVLTELQYHFPEQVQSDLKEVRSVFSDLRLYSDFYCFPNKQKRQLLFLAGTIPVFFHGSLYNYPVCIWLHQTHPASRPRCSVVPSVSMTINPHCRHVDLDGNIHLTLLQNWTQGESSLTLLVSEMKQAFEEDTPLYSRPLPLPQTTPIQPQTPLAAGCSSGSGSGKVLVQKLKRSYCEDLKGIDFSSSSSNNSPQTDQTRSDLSPFRSPAHSTHSDVLRAITALRLNSSPEHTSQSERMDPTGQSERMDPTGQSERMDPTGQSERMDPTGQSEQNRKPRVRPDSEELMELASGLPRQKVQVFLQLLQSEGRSYSTGEILEAVHLNPDLTSAQRYLQHLCPICQDRVSFSKMVTMTHCSCFLCEACFRGWFSAAIREKSVEQLVCPLCGRPEDLDQDYFSLLDTQIRHFLSKELHELFQRKLRDRALTEMKHFCWCSHCSFGLVHESASLRMDCPSCNKSTCSRCRAPWSPQHQGVSCEDFRVQTRTWTGAEHLSNCIECPDCGESYSGSRGGCLHFSCPRCGTDFCGGCSQRFVPGQSCSFSESCWSRGLHAHHPRDCVYHLRDWSVSRLQMLLQFYSVSPSWIEPASQGAEPSPASGVCPVLELRDSLEAPCGRAAPPGAFRGYCRAHYVERVVQLLNSFGGDPLVLFSVEELETELRRWNRTVPTRGPSEPEQRYRARLTAVVLQTVPLKNHTRKPSLWTMVSAPPPPPQP